MPTSTPPLSRGSLPAEKHSSIDTELKQLKIQTRRLRTTLATHNDELRVLDRLHYKGRNQHRAALFWRRVNELRRYARRACHADVASACESIRLSFFGEQEPKVKALRASWTHLPSREYVQLTRRHLQMCHTLLLKSYEKYAEIFRFFTLAMQTGAFLQLMVTLVAISSRLAILAQELHEVVSGAIKTLDNLSSIIEPSLPVNEAPPDENTAEPTIIKEVNSEDDATTLISFDHYSNFLIAESQPALLSASKEKSDIGPSPSEGPLGSMHSAVSYKSKPKDKEEEGAPRKKKKKKRNEIDDIFGF